MPVVRIEGKLPDPVHSGKGMAGRSDEIRKGTFSKDETIALVHTNVFVHTNG
jgi:1-aminocyclopropane-1-carboxylate deaminase/D-cysteine desulfhydrase-like pyridoxal-dependent ACC family enzyme